MEWFSIDNKGLRSLIEAKPKGHLIRELVSNSLDEDVTTVRVTLTQENRRGVVTVEDDSPEGFRRIEDAFTMFAPSYKKTDPVKRGRFNMGEKLVIAVCDEAEIRSTTGGVRFDNQGRHMLRRRRERGTVFKGSFRMSRQEYEQCLESLREIIPQQDVKVSINGVELPTRKPAKTFEVTLPTVIADEEGVLRPTRRKAQVELHEPLPDERPGIYEMGIPVVETGDRWHYNVLQKVPLNADRDNVTPAYLRELRVAVANEMATDLSAEEANASWVREAAADERISDEAVSKIADLRFGEKRVSQDPSDPEANRIAASQGYTVINGSQASSNEWANLRRAGAVRPAGKVTPSPKPYNPNAEEAAELIREPSWSPGMRQVSNYAKGLAVRLLNVATLRVVMVRAGNNFSACYSRGNSPELQFNLTVLDQEWFAHGINDEIDSLIIHEFGHHYSGDHLSADFHDALCTLGARLKRLALEEPEFFGGSIKEQPN